MIKVLSGQRIDTQQIAAANTSIHQIKTANSSSKNTSARSGVSIIPPQATDHRTKAESSQISAKSLHIFVRSK
jgi:hypothetical protein